MHECTQDLHIISCIFEKLGLCFKVTFPSKSQLYQMKFRQNVSKLTYYFTERPCLSARSKKTRKGRFSGQKMVNRSRDWPNRLNRLRYQSTGYPFSIEVRLRVTVTCQALNALMASELVDPQLDRLRLFFDFLALEVRNL